MYLSKVTMQSTPQAVQEALRLGGNGAYTAHQLLWQLFSDESERNFLFREELAVNGYSVFYVLSKNSPSIDSLIFSVQTKRFQPKLKVGQRLAYTLRANATVCLKDANGKSKRHDVLMHAKRQAKQAGVTDAIEIQAMMDQAAIRWLADTKRLQSWGVTLDVLPGVERYTQHCSQKKSGHKLQFSSVDFQGVLTIVEPEIFLAQYEKGFGRSKSLGCGLMLIRPV